MLFFGGEKDLIDEAGSFLHVGLDCCELDITVQESASCVP